mgnify:CR=1 FL=1
MHRLHPRPPYYISEEVSTLPLLSYETSMRTYTRPHRHNVHACIQVSTLPLSSYEISMRAVSNYTIVGEMGREDPNGTVVDVLVHTVAASLHATNQNG